MSSISKRQWAGPDGKEKVAWRLSYKDPRGRLVHKQFRSKKEAEAARRIIEQQLAEGTYRAAASKTTVADLAEKYLDAMQARHDRGAKMGRSHLATIRGRIRNHVLHSKHGLGTVALSHLSTGMVVQFSDDLRAAGVSPALARKVISTFSTMIKFGRERDLIATNPADGIRLVPEDGETFGRRVVPPTKEDLRKLLAAAEEMDAEILGRSRLARPSVRQRAPVRADVARCIRFAAATGLRASEQWALRWRHVDLDAGSVRVETRVDQYGQEGHTKTLAGEREVPLGDGTLQMLREWRVQSCYSGNDDPVFPSREGTLQRHANFVHRKFEPALERANIPRIGWHSLRHFAISTWIEADMKPKAVQTIAGHSSITVTMDRYGHLFPSDDHRAAMTEIAKLLHS